MKQGNQGRFSTTQGKTSAQNNTRGADEANDLGQVIHKLNQPLTAINNYAQAGCQLIENGLSDPERLKELFGKIAAQSLRTIEISQQLQQVVQDSEDNN